MDKLPDNFGRPAMFPPWAAVLVTPSPSPHKSVTVSPARETRYDARRGVVSGGTAFGLSGIWI